MNALLLVLAAQASALSPLGYWTNQRRTVTVQISPCGDARICGRVEWASGRARADASRGGTARLVGVQLLSDFVSIGPSRWKGILFVPDLNRRSKAELIQEDADHLRIKGCAVGRVLCKAQLWSRTTEPRIEPGTDGSNSD